jgi:putative acetyltransferase
MQAKLPPNFEWPEPWQPISDEAIASSLLAELLKEVGQAHCLFQQAMKAVARREDDDDVLFLTSDPARPLAVVHLTWRGSPEPEPSCPGTTFFTDWKDWVADTMNQKAHVYIDTEHPDDSAEIKVVVEAAFSSSPWGHYGEADLIERLRDACPGVLSLVAKHEDRVVGHVLFSPVVIEGGGSLCGMGLGPVAVSPAFQRRGIGTLLITRGIETLNERGCSFVCVLGEPDFYGRFGFRSAQQFGIDSEFGGAAEGTFQILWLRDRPATYQGGVMRYRPEFSSLGHECE